MTSDIYCSDNINYALAISTAKIKLKKMSKNVVVSASKTGFQRMKKDLS